MSLIPARRWSRQIRMALAFDEKAKGCGNLPVSSRAAAENTSSAPSSVSRRASAGFAEEVQVFSYPGRGFQGSRHALNHICAQAQKPHGHAHGAAMRIGGTLGQRRPPAFKAGRALSTWFRVPAHCGSKELKSSQTLYTQRETADRAFSERLRAHASHRSKVLKSSPTYRKMPPYVQREKVNTQAALRNEGTTARRKTKGNRIHLRWAGHCHLHRPDQSAPFQSGFECARRAIPRR